MSLRLPILSVVLATLGAAASGVAGAAADAAAGAATAQASIELPGERAFPENVAASRDGTIYVGSLGSGGVYRVQPHSKEAKVWIKPGAYGTHSVFGVLVDDKTNTLWVCTNDLTARGLAIGDSDGINSLKGFDLKSGEGKISAAIPGKPGTCNDITIGPDGAAYVSNTAAPQILRLAPGGKQLEVWFTDASLQPEKGAGLDGLAFGPDGNLYVNRFTPGDLYRINVKHGKALGFTKLTTSRPLVLTDAIRRYGKDQFLLVEGAGRLDRFTVQGDNVNVETLAEGYSGPTGVAIVGKTAWVSEGQLSFVFDPNKKDQQKVPFHIYSVALTGATGASTK